MSSPFLRGLLLWAALQTGCEGEQVLVPETPTTAPPAAQAPAPAVSDRPLGASSGKPPLLGSDPYGLLSKPSPTSGEKRKRIDPSKLDPSALMAADDNPRLEATGDALERDPRAVARGQVIEVPRPVDDKKAGAVKVVSIRAGAVASRVIRGGGRPHVLLLYGAYCAACRAAMPRFVASAQAYAARNVGFTLASVDPERERFTEYAPILGGAFDALWIEREGPGTTKAALKRLGIMLEGDSYTIPLVAVFDRNRSVVSMGAGKAMGQIAKTLDALLLN